MTALLVAVLVANTFLFGVSKAQAETLEELQAKVEQQALLQEVLS